MDSLTTKERSDLESVFAVICNDNSSKFMKFYRKFYRDLAMKFRAKIKPTNVKNRIWRRLGF